MIGELIICSGLILDIAGVILLFYFGLPSKYPQGDLLLVRRVDEAEKQEQIKFNRLSKLGICLLALGFSLQIVGTMFDHFFKF